MMLMAWTSATNCARIFNASMTEDVFPDWQFSLSVTSDQVYDGFTILSLLEDCISQQKTLVVPHGGASRDRFTEAICIRNNRLRLCSQPELYHYCKKCTRIFESKLCSPLYKLTAQVFQQIPIERHLLLSLMV